MGRDGDETMDAGVNHRWRLLHMVLCIWCHILPISGKASWLKAVKEDQKCRGP